VHWFQKFDFIDFSFHENDLLFELVDSKKLDFAVVTKQYDTFDTIQKKRLRNQTSNCNSSTIDASELKSYYNKGFQATEHWLNDKNGSVIMRKFHIKLFWLHVF
jgi:hypothetical protein